MQAPITIRPLEAHEWPTHRALRLRSLADSPDAFGSTLAAEQQRPPEAWAARMATAAVSGVDYPLIAELFGAPAGLVWAKADGANPSLVELFQMWVAPESRGCGVAAALLGEAIKWARTRQARELRLGVTCGDTSAMRLYLRAGFQAFGAPEPLRADCPLLSQPMRLVISESAEKRTA